MELTAPPDPLAGFEGLLLRGREERRDEGGDRRCEEGVGEREGIWLIGPRAMATSLAKG